MTTHEMGEWLNRIGLVLGFLAFWFVAPEFIGEARLQKWERSLAGGLLKLPFAVQVIIIILGVCQGLFNINERLRKGQFDATTIVLSILAFITITTGILLKTYGRAFRKIISKLANDEHIRQRSLFVGGLLFTLSFMAQLIATFL